MKKRMNRSTARAHAMKLVYEWEMGGEGGEETRLNLLEVKPDETEYAFMNALYEGVVAERERIDALIAEYARGWSLDRLSRVDLAILRVGAYELTSGANPPAIVINEAVELANTFSGDKAGPFVNGVLGSIARSEKI